MCPGFTASCTCTHVVSGRSSQDPDVKFYRLPFQQQTAHAPLCALFQTPACRLKPVCRAGVCGRWVLCSGRLIKGPVPSYRKPNGPAGRRRCGWSARPRPVGPSLRWGTWSMPCHCTGHWSCTKWERRLAAAARETKADGQRLHCAAFTPKKPQGEPTSLTPWSSQVRILEEHKSIRRSRRANIQAIPQTSVSLHAATAKRCILQTDSVGHASHVGSMLGLGGQKMREEDCRQEGWRRGQLRIDIYRTQRKSASVLVLVMANLCWNPTWRKTKRWWERAYSW